jgi:multicomponent Na+:H+ antiporter subunit F
MLDFLLALAAFLVLTLAGGLMRVARGPTRADAMLAAQLFATTGVGILLVLSEAMAAPSLRDVALAIALLTAIAAVAFVRRRAGNEGAEDSP